MNSRALLADLVAFPSVSSRSNRDIADFIAARLRATGFRVATVPHGDKLNVLASLGPDTGDGLVLSGHTDVVPVQGQRWGADPFRLVERDGRLFARGAADMKGFLACILALAERVTSTRLKAPLHLSFSCDEEVGCVGIRPMLDHLAGIGFAARLCVVGEPTEMQVVTGHKGKLAARATCTGTAAHSSLAPRAQNAIHLACDFVGVLRAEQDRLTAEGAHDPSYDIPYTTVHAGLIAGGTALNIVPDCCRIDFEFRTVGGDRGEALLDGVASRAAPLAEAARQRFPEASVAFETTNSYPGLMLPANHDVVRLVQAAVGADSVRSVAFGTEAGLFMTTLGLPTVVCGPGSIEQAHKADEWIAADELDRCDAMLDRLVEACCRA